MGYYNYISFWPQPFRLGLFLTSWGDKSSSEYMQRKSSISKLFNSLKSLFALLKIERGMRQLYSICPLPSNLLAV